MQKQSRKFSKSIRCKLCSGRADYRYVGVLVCGSCKVFFKRNAENKEKDFSCHFNGRCEINEETRRSCTFCRLRKCFQVGMQVERLRGPLTKQKLINETKQIAKIQTLSLLRSDRSTLTGEQWILISNLIHCYDEQCKILTAKRFLIQQSSLPMKIRFRNDFVQGLIHNLVGGVQELFSRNQDFRSLTSNDQSVLLERSLKHIAGLSSTFTLEISCLYQDEGFDQTLSSIYGSRCVVQGKLASSLLDQDLTVVKLLLAIMIFSTLDCNSYRREKINYLENVPFIQRIQDRYVELTWKYLIYHNGFHRAVRTFSNIVRAIFAAIRSLTDATDLEDFQNIIDSVTDETKENLNITN